ncbi:MAG: adenylosuccinate synthetase, partial [Thermoplasmata archaeon]
ALTKVDTLGMMNEVKVCEAYEINGKASKSPPKDIASIKDFKPVYRSFEPWGDMSDIQCRDALKKNDLPKKLKEYIEFIEKETRVPISIISAGKERSRTIEIKN